MQNFKVGMRVHDSGVIENGVVVAVSNNSVEVEWDETEENHVFDHYDIEYLKEGEYNGGN